MRSLVKKETFLSSTLPLMCKIVCFYLRGSLSILLVERTCTIFGISHLKGLMARKFFKAFPLYKRLPVQTVANIQCTFQDVVKNVKLFFSRRQT